jgi:hypothetical protein
MDIEIGDNVSLEDLIEITEAMTMQLTSKAMMTGAEMTMLPVSPELDQLIAEVRKELYENVPRFRKSLDVVILFLEQGQLVEAAKILCDMQGGLSRLITSAGMLGMHAQGFPAEVSPEVEAYLNQVNANVDAALERVFEGEYDGR